ncbi:MAG: hypothetical protein K0Q90_2440 [Paenibacillaceae bacterium]|nr:hypothetical protein [Paenibacillaceae bacterium]
MATVGGWTWQGRKGEVSEVVRYHGRSRGCTDEVALEKNEKGNRKVGLFKPRYTPVE